MSKNPIQWFPGHMAKTRRLIKECLPKVDIVLELLDARIPYSSKNPEIREIVGDKPKLTVLTKSTLADAQASRAWQKFYEHQGEKTVIIDSQSGFGLDKLEDAVKQILADKIQRYKDKGMDGRRLKAMIVGIPNVGKSSLINKLARGVKAKVENRPGVTLDKQWVSTDIGIDLLDMPGVLWPKFEDETVGENLALTGAIRDKILDVEELAMILCERLKNNAKDEFFARYKLTDKETEDLDCYDLFCLIGKKRGYLVSGGEVNQTRTAQMLLEEFRSAKIGKITLEIPR